MILDYQEELNSGYHSITILGYINYKMKRQKKEKKLLNIDKLINDDIYKKENKI